MPYISTSTYRAKGIFRHRHINTIYPALFRKVPHVEFERERIYTPDEDFLDLDWSKKGNDKIVLVLHGLEGAADRGYIRGMARYFNQKGWDAVGLNFRSCSGEPNWQLQSYHMGATDDVHTSVQHIVNQGYRHIGVVGFSLGGNVTLNYLGNGKHTLPKEVIGGTAISVPCHIVSANDEISKWENSLYLYRFMRTLKEKIKEKSERFPGQVAYQSNIPIDFKYFDDKYTAPIHGFKDALDYWESTSSLYILPQLQRPALLINAWDDTFLSKKCYPIEQAKRSNSLWLETPPNGGHCGFVTNSKDGHYWTEYRAYHFLKELIE